MGKSKLDEMEPLVDRKEMLERTGLTPKFVEKQITRDDFPRYKLSRRCVMFRVSEVEAWIKMRKIG